jgi:hypothetical protein
MAVLSCDFGQVNQIRHLVEISRLSAKAAQ